MFKGPTECKTYLAGKRYPLVILVLPGLQPPKLSHSFLKNLPAPLLIHPSIPPPPNKPGLAALTIASISNVLISP